jgi:hypothetical protein
MTRDDFIKALADGHTHYNDSHILVRTRSGAEYLVHEDQLDGFEDGKYDHVFGTRNNGRIHMKGRRRVDTRDQLRSFKLGAVTLVKP